MTVSRNRIDIENEEAFKRIARKAVEEAMRVGHVRRAYRRLGRIVARIEARLKGRKDDCQG